MYKQPASILTVSTVTLNGISQIMLQENKWTGLLFLGGLFLGSWQCGVAAIMASITGAVTARLLHFNVQDIRAGIYGFSAALVGVALTFLYEASLLIWLLVIGGSALAALFQHLFVRLNIPGYTFPFILITWIIVFILNTYGNFSPSQLFLKTIDPSPYDAVYSSINGFGQVIFQAGVLSGAVFFLGVFISSPIAALYALAASLLGAWLSQLDGQPPDNIHLGLFGFNAVLTAIVFAGSRKIDGLWVLIGCLLTIYINIFLVKSHWLDSFGGAFTFPFVFATWVTLFLQKKFITKQVVSSVPL